VSRSGYTPLDALIGKYRTWLLRERGLAASTVLRYGNTARRFLAQRAVSEGIFDPTRLTGVDVNVFLLSECGRVSAGSAKGRVAELRAVLRFLYLQGSTVLELGAAVSPVGGWRLATLPPTMTAADVQLMLEGCDRGTGVGVRDFAIMMLLARLGLRSIEVARLELRDVDWRAGEIVVRGKARRQDRLPLPSEVGDALVAYLSGERVRPRPPGPVGAAGSCGTGPPPDTPAAGNTRTVHRAPEQRGVDGPGSEVSPGQLLEHVDVQGLIGDDLLQPLVLLLQLLESFGVLALHPAVLGHPAMPGRGRHLQVLAHLVDVLALIQQLLTLAELADRLLRGVPSSRHDREVLLRPSSGIGLSQALAPPIGTQSHARRKVDPYRRPPQPADHRRPFAGAAADLEAWTFARTQ